MAAGHSPRDNSPGPAGWGAGILPNGCYRATWRLPPAFVLAWHSSLSALLCNLAKGQATVGMDGIPAGKGLPPSDRDIDVTRIQIHRTGLASDPFGRK